MFVYEKAQAMVYSGRLPEALALYDQITDINAHVSARNLAVARRGKGFVLIEMDDLDGAEQAFRSSLEIDPDNEVALHELTYIEHLRQGGPATHMEAVATTSPNFSECAVCGNKFDQGVVIPVEGRLVSLCQRCQGKLTKKWWQFWK
jgi:tetratricopeptide (TPR) repeat protein